jgi:excisionase family DNA binding protein
VGATPWRFKSSHPHRPAEQGTRSPLHRPVGSTWAEPFRFSPEYICEGVRLTHREALASCREGRSGDCIPESRVPEGPRFLVEESETQTAAAERLITAKELGELFQLSMDTVLDWFEDGRLPGYRLGGKKGGPVRFRLSEIEGLLEGWRVPAVALPVSLRKLSSSDDPFPRAGFSGAALTMPAQQRGSVEKLAKCWSVRFVDENGVRRRQGGFVTKTQARNWLDSKINEIGALRRGEGHAQARQDLSVSERTYSLRRSSRFREGEGDGVSPRTFCLCAVAAVAVASAALADQGRAGT